MVAVATVQSDGDIKAQLQLVLDDPSFKSAPRLSALLTYLVEQSLAGDKDNLKAEAIARAVFGRDESFDSQSDTIVRVEAGRLRRRLAQYYDGDGRQGELVIDVPKGAYSPKFSDAPALAEKPEQTQSAGNQNDTLPAQGAVSVADNSRRWLIPLAVSLALISMFALYQWWIKDSRQTVSIEPSKPFIMVIAGAHPGTPMEQRLADRSVESVVTKLAKLNGMSVMAHRSAMRIAEEELSVGALYEQHGITHVLNVRLSIEHNALRTLVEIVDTRTQATIWADQVDGKVSALFEFEDLLSERIAAVLVVTLDPDENERLYLRHSSNLEALELFRYAIRAIYPPTRERLEAGRDLFRRVTELDPKFAGGYAGLALTYSYWVLFELSNSPQQDLELAITYAEEAIAVDPDFGMGIAMLGSAHTLLGNFETGLSYNRQAVGLEPGEPSSHQWLAVSLLRSGRHQEAIAPLQEALRLDPRDPRMPYLCMLGMLHYANGEFVKAVAFFERDQVVGIRRGPYVYAMQAAALVELGDEPTAREMMPQLNRDIVAQDFPVEKWLAGMLPDAELQERTFATLYRLGMLRPRERERSLSGANSPAN